MRSWQIRELVLKLPLLEVKLGPNEKRGLEGTPVGLRVALRAANGLFVTAAMNRRAELVATGPKVDDWEIFEVYGFPIVRLRFVPSMASLSQRRLAPPVSLSLTDSPSKSGKRSH
jgi:hypothetical protein